MNPKSIKVFVRNEWRRFEVLGTFLDIPVLKEGEGVILIRYTDTGEREADGTQIWAPIFETSEAEHQSSVKWQLWTEGYAITGNSAGATYHGEWSGETFADACQAWANTLDEPQRRLFNRERLSFWGCRFFDNEADARKSFG